MKRAAKRFLAGLGLFAFGLVAGAQTMNTVTGTVTDPNGLPFSGASITALLVDSAGNQVKTATLTNGQTYNAQPVTANMSTAGTFSMVIVSNSSVASPAGSKYTFQVQAPNIPGMQLVNPQNWNISLTQAITATTSLSSALSALAQPISLVDLQNSRTLMATVVTPSVNIPGASSTQYVKADGSGAGTPSGAAQYINGTTIAALPSAASSSNQVWTIYDGASSSDCTTGLGSTQVLCYSNGSAWAQLGGGGSAPSATEQLGYSYIFWTSGPLALVNGSVGSGYTGTGTCTLTGGNLVSGSADTCTATLSTGTIVTALVGSGVYSTPPSLAVSGFSTGSGFVAPSVTVNTSTVYSLNTSSGTVASNADAGVVVRNAIATMNGSCGSLHFKQGIYPVNSLALESLGNYTSSGFTTGAGTPIDYAFAIPNNPSPGTVCHWLIDGEGNPTYVYNPGVGGIAGVNWNGTIFNITSTAISSVTAGNYIVGWWAQPNISSEMFNQSAFISMSNLGIRFPDNQRGNEGAVDFGKANYLGRMASVVADFNETVNNLAVPVSGTVGLYGIVYPEGQETGMGVSESNKVLGYWVDYDYRGENLVSSVDYAFNAQYCAVIGARGRQVYHASVFNHLACVETINGVLLGNNMQLYSELEFSALDFEDATASFEPAFQPVTHMQETSIGNSWGTISYNRTLAGVGNSPLLILFDGGGGPNFTTKTATNVVQMFDSFTGGSGTALTSHTADSGQTWSNYQPQSGTNGVVDLNGSNQIYVTTLDVAEYYASLTPTSADYTVSLLCNPGGSGFGCGPQGRTSTSAYTTYQAVFVNGTGVQLVKVVAGSATQLGSTYSGITSGTHTVGLRMVGTSISALMDGTVVVGPITDSSISAAGKPSFVISGSTPRVSSFAVQ